jgi:uncharacterized protein YdiU (UPF0061 family)
MRLSGGTAADLLPEATLATDPQPTPPPESVGWNFDNTYVRLPEVFHARTKPARVREPRVCVLNHRLGEELGLNLRALPGERAAAVFAGQEIPHGADPVAQAYAGHQFGGFSMLGDGRALLLGEHVAPNGRRADLQFKGSGPTAFSRRGDGRAALGPMLREYIVGEAMHALGIPTTRALAVVTTGEAVYREQPLRGAVLTRVASSHIRVGTFQYAAALRDEANLRALADYTIARHDPGLAEEPEKYLRFLEAVTDRQATLVARWQLVGFVHGVMNTDNVAVSGETIDFGPCAFLDAYDPATVFSSIDHGGRYAYGNQPGIGQWNLARFAEALLPLLAPDPAAAVEAATAVLNRYPEQFEQYWLAGMRRKLGLRTEEPDDTELAGALLAWMKASQADFTNTFSDLSDDGGPVGDRYRDEGFRAWHGRWRDRLAREGGPTPETFAGMRAVNPFVIPRNHRVEEALAAATNGDDLGALERLVEVLRAPFDRSPAAAGYREAAPPGPRYRTFCGT